MQTFAENHSLAKKYLKIETPVKHKRLAGSLMLF